MKVCHYCQKVIEVGRVLSRRATCPHCESDLYCCLNCALYSEYAPNKCKEPQSEYVSDRERANFCDFFTFAEAQPEDKALQRDRLEEARRKFEALFRKGPKQGL